MEKIVVADAHLHSNPIRGLGARKIAEKFKENNGWFMALIMLPTWSYGRLARKIGEYKKALKMHLRECREARETGIRVACFAGLHPAEIDKLLAQGHNPYSAIEYGEQVIEHLYTLCDEMIIDGIGEIGRQHYKTRPESLLVAERILEYALHLNREHDCPLQLHTENLKGFTARNIREIVDEKGCNPGRVLLHHAGPGVVDEAVENRLWSTTPAYKENLKYILEKGFKARYMVETDYTDSPEYRGTAPWELKELMEELVSAGIADEELVWRLNHENIIEYFGTSY